MDVNVTSTWQNVWRVIIILLGKLLRYKRNKTLPGVLYRRLIHFLEQYMLLRCIPSLIKWFTGTAEIILDSHEADDGLFADWTLASRNDRGGSIIIVRWALHVRGTNNASSRLHNIGSHVQHMRPHGDSGMLWNMILASTSKNSTIKETAWYRQFLDGMWSPIWSATISQQNKRMKYS